MRLLALDTSSDACSVALELDDRVVDRHVVLPRQQTRILVPMIEALLETGGITLSDLDGIVLGNGPGSFIGVRIAGSVAQGIAFAAGLRIVPVSSLAAIAAEAFSRHEATHALVAQDARMNEVYLAAFGRDDGADLPLACGDVVLHDASTPIDPGRSERSVLAGGGWRRYPTLFSDATHADVLDIAYPRARFLLALGRRGLEAGAALPPEEVRPAYVRLEVARPPP